MVNMPALLLSCRLAVGPGGGLDIGVERGGDGADDEAMILPHRDDATLDVDGAIFLQRRQPSVALEKDGGVESVPHGDGRDVGTKIAHQPFDDVGAQPILGR